MQEIITFSNNLTSNYRLPSSFADYEEGLLGRYSEQRFCSHDVLAIESQFPDNTKSLLKRENLQFKKLLPFREKLQYRNLTEEEIRRCLQILKEHTLYLSMITDSGERRTFEGNKKGLARYNKKASAKIRDCITQMVDSGYECFFATTTFDPKFNGNDRADAWLNYYNDFMALLKQERNHKGLKVCWVLESTKKGYPHIHAIIGYPKGTYKNYDKIPVNKKLRFGRVVELFKGSKVFRVFEVKKPSDNGIKWYLTKYITKNSTEDIFAMINQKEPLSAEQLKTAYALLYTTMCKKRLFGVCKINQNKKDNEDSMENEQEINVDKIDEVKTDDEAVAIYRSGKNLGRVRPYLRKLCTNFPCKNPKRVSCISLAEADAVSNGEIWKEEGISNETFDKIFAKSKRLTCGGCFYSHLVNFIENGDDDFINITLPCGSRAGQKYFEPSDFQNDDVYVKKLLDLIVLYIHFTQDTGGRLVEDWKEGRGLKRYLLHRYRIDFDLQDKIDSFICMKNSEKNAKCIDTIAF